MAKRVEAGRVMGLGGRRVLVLAVDSDPSCLVWVSFMDDPDADAMVRRSELS